MIALIRHPATPSAITGVAVEASRPAPGLLALRYVVTDPDGALVLPAPTAAERTDGLWRRTCFEAFVRAPGAEAYHELNLSPSTAWAAYRFDAYRAGMAAADIAEPRIATGGAFELTGAMDLSRLPGLAGPWRLGVSAVIEDKGGRTSYWALAHPPGDPDFHHADGFVLDLG